MYRKPPNAAELAAQGLTLADFDADVELWPENMTTVEVFASMTTQWQTGMNGPTGLRYEALPVVLDLLGIAAPARRDVFDGLRVMERAALAEMREAR